MEKNCLEKSYSPSALFAVGAGKDMQQYHDNVAFIKVGAQMGYGQLAVQAKC